MRVFGKLILAALLITGTAQAETLPEISAQITVIGEGTVTAVPDLATVTLGVTTTDPIAAAAMKANSTALSAVMDRLQAAGIAQNDLQTSSLQLNPNWTNSENGTMTVMSYTATNMLSVRVRDLTILGLVLDAAITDGANTLNGISFGQSDPRPTQDAARQAAVADAIARAKLLTQAAGVTLGRVLSISEGAGFGAPMPMMKAADMAQSVPVAAGELGVTASVSMMFEVVN